MAKQPKQLSQADWMFRHLKELCMLHHKSNPISEQIINSIPIIVKYINTFDNMTEEMITIIRDFMKKIKKNRYNLQIVVKMLLHMKQIARNYSMHFGNDEFDNLFAHLKDFLNYQMCDVQFAAINSLICIFDKNWIGENVSAVSLKLFHRKLFDFLLPETTEIIEREDLDYRARHICIRGQLIAGLISSSYALRKESWFSLAELCSKNQLNSGIHFISPIKITSKFIINFQLFNLEKIRPIISALCDYHQMDHDMLVNENISYLVSEWLVRNYSMVDFPWYLTTRESQSDFLRDNVSTMTICILRHQPAALDDFAVAMGENKKDLMKVIF